MSVKTVLLSGAALVWLAVPALADGGPVPEPTPPPPPPVDDVPEYQPEPEPAPPAPAESLWYLEGFLGVSYADQLGYNASDFDMDLGYHGGGAAGRHLTPNIDVEAEVFYSIMGYEDFETSVSGLSFMINGYYRFDTGAFVDPYVGAGVGLTRIRYDGGDQFPAFTGHDNLIGYQGIAGLMFHLPEVDLFLEYRYQDTIEDAEIEGIPGIEFETHHGSAGFRINF